MKEGFFVFLFFFRLIPNIAGLLFMVGVTLGVLLR